MRRTRLVLVLACVLGAVTGLAPALAPAQAAPPPKAVKELVTITRTHASEDAALAIIGRVKVDRRQGFFGVVDRRAGQDSSLVSMTDLGWSTGLLRYGHGQSAPACDIAFVCAVSPEGDELVFRFTTTDLGGKGSAWTGLTRYLVVEGTSFELKVAAIGFSVKRRAAGSFARLTAERADADGIAYGSIGAEVFRAASLAGGPRGSLAVLQLPCEVEGAGAVTFSATGDFVPHVADCKGSQSGYYAGVGPGYVGIYPTHAPGRFERSASGPVQWDVSGAVTGVTTTRTRLFVLSF